MEQGAIVGLRGIHVTFRRPRRICFPKRHGMKVFIVLAHPEHQSFNGALFRTAIETLSSDGHEGRTSDLYPMRFDPVTGRHNFITVKDPNFFKPQIEEM